MKLKCILFLSFLFFLQTSCKQENGINEDIKKIPIEIDIERFDLAVKNTGTEQLSSLKAEYPFMFPKNFPDSSWVNMRNDTLQQRLLSEVESHFKDIIPVKNDITNLFKHLKYYNKSFKTPRVITTTSNVDYRNKVIVTDSIVLISLDTFLGESHEFYENIPQYLRQNFNADQIVVAIADAYAKKNSFATKRKTLLDDIIENGKQLYFKDKVIPFKTDAEKIGYTQAQLKWGEDNESFIWRYFVDKKMLFDTDPSLANRFINNAPFSKFYLEEIDTESPGRIGCFIGWQIVKSYMENNDLTLKALLQKSTEEIYNNSRYKPRK